MDNLVHAYTGESSSHTVNHSSSENAGSSNFFSGSGHQFSEENCLKHNTHAQKQFEHLDLARDQLTTAQNKVQELMDQAVEGQMGMGPEVSEAHVKRAEKEQEQLTKAEGKLDRTQCQLQMKQEAHRQAKQQFQSQQQAAEERILNKYGSVNPELRQELLNKLRPMINKDAQARNNHQALEDAANWYMKTDSKAQRLQSERQPDTSKSGMEDSARLRDRAALNKESQAKATTSGKRANKAQAKRQKLEQSLQRKLNSNSFDEQLKTTKPGERSELVQKEIEPLKAVSSKSAQEFEEKLNRKLGETEKASTATGQTVGMDGKNQEKKQQAVDRLMEAKYKRAGEAGQNVEPLKKTIDALDTDSVKQTKKTLENLNLDDITSLVDLERKFGRGVHDVRTDLEQQIARGGKSVGKARRTLTKLDKVIRRSELLSSQDSWGALRQSTGSTGPNLGNFLGVSSTSNSSIHRESARPLAQQFDGPDKGTAKKLVQRMNRSGSRADSVIKRQTLERFRGFGA